MSEIRTFELLPDLGWEWFVKESKQQGKYKTTGRYEFLSTGKKN